MRFAQNKVQNSNQNYTVPFSPRTELPNPLVSAKTILVSLPVPAYGGRGPASVHAFVKKGSCQGMSMDVSECVCMSLLGTETVKA